MIQLNKRLRVCADYVPQGSRVADIGTDHGLLPVWLVENGIAVSAIASDIAQKPIERARVTVNASAVGDRIKLVCAPGLDGVEPGSVDCVVIAGLGGDVMVSVLEAARWLRDGCRLILQPMSRPETVRSYLFSNGWYLVSERAVTDAGRAYVVMCAERGENKLTDPVDVYAGLLGEGSGETGAQLLERSARILSNRALGAEPSEAERMREIARRLGEMADGLRKENA